MTSSVYSHEEREEARAILIKKCPHNIDYALGIVERMAVGSDLSLVNTARLVAALLPDPPENRTKIKLIYGFDGELCPVHATQTTDGVCSSCSTDTESRNEGS